MATSHVKILAVGVISAVLAVAGSGQTASSRSGLPPPAQTPALINTCLITSHVKELVAFYERVLGIKAKWAGDYHTRGNHRFR
jgi:hypothetical protein